MKHQGIHKFKENVFVKITLQVIKQSLRVPHNYKPKREVGIVFRVAES